MARKFRGTSNHCPSVASDQDTDPKVAGSNPLMTIPGQDPASRLAHKHVVHENVVGGSSVLWVFPLVIAVSEQDMPEIETGPLGLPVQRPLTTSPLIKVG